MRTRGWLLVVSIGLSLAALVHGQPESGVALTGQVTSVAEGPMEGVLVSAKRLNSTITVTVISDAQGQYRFPTAKLSPGQYAVRIRAVGYDIDSPSNVEITQGKTTTANLKLSPAHDL